MHYWLQHIVSPYFGQRHFLIIIRKGWKELSFHFSSIYKKIREAIETFSSEKYKKCKSTYITLRTILQSDFYWKNKFYKILHSFTSSSYFLCTFHQIVIMEIVRKRVISVTIKWKCRCLSAVSAKCKSRNLSTFFLFIYKWKSPDTQLCIG